MKKLVYALLTLALPMSAMAQPVIDSAEYYHVGEMFNYRHCSGVTPGPAGANQTWNFASVTDSLVETDTILAATNPANAMMTFNSITTYMAISDTETAVTGIDVGATASVSYNSNITSVLHPISYLDTASSSFNETLSAAVTGTGAGTSIMKVDGYGTLITPQGTFPNVLRVKFTQTEIDTTGFGNETISFVSYRWYDSTHHYPLMRIDSTLGTGLAPILIASWAYYTTDTPTAVKNISTKANITNAHLDNNGLTIKANLTQGHQYTVGLVDGNGHLVFVNTFVASGRESEHFNIPVALPAGTYFGSVSELNTRKQVLTIKVLKQ
ncbi:MAG: hypothetical protein JSS82_20280 [Bacteroidetes bacterium]|nr:hypothetical protein [Bacteroidota bacterium]